VYASRYAETFDWSFPFVGHFLALFINFILINAGEGSYPIFDNHWQRYNFSEQPATQLLPRETRSISPRWSLAYFLFKLKNKRI